MFLTPILKRIPWMRFLCLTLAVSIVVTSQPIVLFAQSAENNQALRDTFRDVLTPAELKALEEISDQVGELRRNFGDSEDIRPSPLDTYGLTHQVVVHRPQEILDARNEHIRQADFEARRNEEIDWLLSEARKNYERTMVFLGRDNVVKAATLLSERTGQEINLETDLPKILEGARTDNDVAAAIDIVPEKEIESFVPETAKMRHIGYRRNLIVFGTDRYGTIEFAIRQAEYEGSTAAGFNSRDFFVERDTTPNRFSLATADGEVFHRFLRPVSALGFYGRYLVYVYKDSFDAEKGYLPLKFIDLEFFRGALGNSPLPEYTLPRAVGEFRSLEIKDGKLLLNGDPIGEKLLDLAARMHRDGFSGSVAAANVATQASSTNLIKDLSHAFDISLEEARLMQDTMVDAGMDALPSAQLIRERLEASLQRRTGIPANLNGADLRQFVENNPGLFDPEEPTGNTVVREVLNRDRLLQINRAVAANRKFDNRLRLLGAKILQPQPAGAPKILQGLAMLSQSVLAGNWDRAGDNVSDLYRHPLTRYVTYGAGTLAAASLGPFLPEPIAFSLYDAVNVGRNVAGMINDYLVHIDHGMAFIDLGVNHTLPTVASGIPSVPERYFSEWGWPRLTTLAVALGSMMATMFFTLHLLSNSAAAGMYIKNHRNWRLQAQAQGMSRLESFKATYLRFQSTLRRSYERAQAAEEAKISGSTRTFTWAHDEIAEEMLADLQERHRGIFRRGIHMVKKGTIRVVSEGKAFYFRVRGWFADARPWWKREGAAGSATGATATETHAAATPPASETGPVVEMTPAQFEEMTSPKNADDLIAAAGEELRARTVEFEAKGESSAQIAEALTENKHIKNYGGMGRALKDLIMSYPSVLVTSGRLGTIWNYWFIDRSLVLAPSTWPFLLMHPQFFRSTIGTTERKGLSQSRTRGTGRLHVSTEIDGGMRPFWRSRLSEVREMRERHPQFMATAGLDDDAEALKRLRIFERSLIPIEGIAYEVALEKALSLLVREIQDPETLTTLFDSTQNLNPLLDREQIFANGSPSPGIRRINDPKLKKLGARERAFFQSIFDQIYGQTVERFLRAQFVDANIGAGEADVASAIAQELQAAQGRDLRSFGAIQAFEMQEISKRLGTDSEFNKKVRNDMSAIADQILQNPEVKTEARRISASVVDRLSSLGRNAVSGRFAGVAEDLRALPGDVMARLERIPANARHKTYEKLDPTNRQVNRFLTAESMMGNLRAMIRAMNSLLTNMVVNKGVGLLTILVMYAGLTEGMLAPLHEEMFSADSFFYGSKFHFLNSFMFGVFLSIMADVWMKVQIDERLHTAGQFDRVPTQEDSKRSYLRYYLKSFSKNPANTWWDNQKHNVKIIWANMGAAFVTIATTNLLTLGRIDMGAFLTGYMVIYLTPLIGIDSKIDQTFELASRWRASQVYRRMRAHPKMQDWINGENRLYRFPHAIAAGVYNFFVEPLVQMYELMNTQQYGPRSFLNLLTGGMQPEGMISKFILQPIDKYLGWIPGVSWFAQGCEYLITNNNTALTGNPHLMNPPGPPPVGR